MLRRKRASPDVYRYHDVVIPMDNPLIHGRIRDVIESGQYESGDVRAMDAMLEADDVVLEVGAGLGFTSAMCAKRIGSDRVFTYEANPQMEPSIRRLYALNDVSPTLTIGAVTNHGGEVQLAEEPEFWVGRIAETGRPVQARDITEELERIAPTFLILDCEGGERDILLGNDLPGGVRKLVAELHPEFIGAQACTEIIRNVLRQDFDIRLEVTGGSLWAFERAPPRRA
jgi:FkbM family methyltransferase